MLFEHDVTVLTTHTIDNKLKTVIKLTKGVMHYFDIYFPPGCAHLVKVKVNRSIHQVIPTNSDGCIKGDGISVSGRFFHRINKQPYQIEVITWNEGASYDHTITVRFWVLRAWQLMPFSDQMYALSIEEDTGYPE